jgi:hypothetical protein
LILSEEYNDYYIKKQSYLSQFNIPNYMRIRQLTFIPGVLALFLAEIACTINIGGPAYPNPSIPVSTEAMGDLSSAIETAVVNGTESGQIMIGITETQLTSYLSYKILALPQPFITNPQVYMENGELQLYGTATEGYFQATVSLVFSASVDEMGRLLIKLNSANFGPLPVPNGLSEFASAAIQEAYTGALGPVATGFRLKSVTIANGSMTIVGQTK